MANADKPGPLSGHVEVDETHVGGYQRRSEQQTKGSNKTIVVGMVERGGKIIAGPVPDVSASTLEAIVQGNVAKGSTISTDELRSYNALESFGYVHGRVNHSAEEWVRGEHHTNTLEGHWSHFKRSIRGTHTSISRKHMWKYVCEFTYRRNHQHSHAAMFSHLVSALCLPRLQDA
jgi:transposase-like protein